MRRTAAKFMGPLLMLSMALFPPAAGAQKSLSDGVDDLASKLAKSFGNGPKGRVAIVPLRELAGNENLLGTYISEIMTNSFFEAGYRDIVERQMLDRAIQELKLKFTGMIDPESAKKIGKFLHADFVVGGTMTELTGEVSVICRMFAVQTGEVVAVATTKIVKDDNVKSMLAKSLGAPKNAAREPAEVEQGADDLTQEEAGISFRLKSCTRRGTAIDCTLSVTALDNDVAIQLSRESRLVDVRGQQATAETISFSTGDTRQTRGAGSDISIDLVRGIARTGHILFEGVGVEKGEVPLIEVQYLIRRLRRIGRVQFRNVKVM
jgi:hypothetical protein